MLVIRPFERSDEASVVALWHDCGLVRPWNDPHKDIARKLSVQPELFLVGTWQQELVASAMVGYDGHRGWIYYLAVAGGRQRLSLGRQMMACAERLLLERACPKLSLMVRTSNQGVLEFYRKLGYARDDAVVLGKRLIADL